MYNEEGCCDVGPAATGVSIYPQVGPLDNGFSSFCTRSRPKLDPQLLSTNVLSARSTCRRPSKPKSRLSVKRSQSTPNVQLAATSIRSNTSNADIYGSAQLPLTALDKKRSKLGYHRTSVACVHCRRRKIRCLPAKDDAESRCSNCLRLNKECLYQAVETPDTRPRSLSKPEMPVNSYIDNTTLVSSMSSPSISPITDLGTSERYFHSNIPTEAEHDLSHLVLTDTIRHPSTSSTGQLSSTFSNLSSRRPSLTHMYSAPLPYREHRSSSDASSLPWMASFAERFEDRMVTNFEMDDPPASAFWNLLGNTFTTNSSAPISVYTHLENIPLYEQYRSMQRGNSVDDGVEPKSQVVLESNPSDFICNNLDTKVPSTALNTSTICRSSTTDTNCGNLPYSDAVPLEEGSTDISEKAWQLEIVTNPCISDTQLLTHVNDIFWEIARNQEVPCMEEQDLPNTFSYVSLHVNDDN